MEGKFFVMYIDQAPLKYLQTQQNLSRRLTRWLETLKNLDFDIQYEPVIHNVVVDALSRIRPIRQPKLNTMAAIGGDGDFRQKIFKTYIVGKRLSTYDSND